MKKLLVIALCAIAAAQPSGQSQTPAEVERPVQGPTFRTGVDVIAVDVAVVDGRGRPVDGLLTPDFVVKIDGVERRIVSAEHVRIDVEAARRQAAAPSDTFFTTNLTPPNGRQILIAVDQLGIRTGEARVVLATASKFLESLSPADRVAFVAYPDPGIYVDFTNDRIRLRQAMERVVGSQQRFVGKFNIGLTEAIGIIDRSDAILFAAVVTRECGRLRGEAAVLCERDILFECREMVRNLRRDASASVQGLAEVLRRLSETEGPKSLILLSEGLILESPTDIDDVVQAAALARVSVSVLLMDVPLDDLQTSQRRPTATDDRQMQLSGLRNLAWGSGGDLYHVVGTGENIFERLSSELAAYYILGVEQIPSDRDGSGHRIDVEVRRQNVTVRSRRAFSLSAATNARRRSPEDAVTDTLRSPFGVADVPLRVTTFARQDPTGGKVRLLVAADVGQPGTPSQAFTIGYALIDQEGRVAASNGERRTLLPAGGNPAAALEYLSEVLVDPGVYSLRLALVDAEGRRAGVVREVQAWKLAGQEFALGDLIVGTLSATGQGVRPGVEPRVRGDLGAFIELYSTSASVLSGATVLFEIASDENSPALVAAQGQLSGPAPTTLAASGSLTPDLLPPGRYVARARVMRNGTVAGLLARPFILEREPEKPGTPLDTAILVFDETRAFDSKAVLASDVVAGMLDSVEKASPDLRSAIAEARAGRYSDAAIGALAAGDQSAAAFLKGLDWYSKGQMDQALTQLQIAAGPRREFFPGAFYLGATLAALGRDRDAAGVWQMAIGAEPRPSQAYLIFADARLRDRQPASVIEVLRPAHDRTPADSEIARRLITAYLLTERYQEVITVLDAYVARNPTDQQALFSAVYAQYQVVTRDRVPLSTADLEKVARYVRAYRGPSEALVERYLEVIRTR